jgi:hypothetical protein
MLNLNNLRVELLQSTARDLLFFPAQEGVAQSSRLSNSAVLRPDKPSRAAGRNESLRSAGLLTSEE